MAGARFDLAFEEIKKTASQVLSGKILTGIKANGTMPDGSSHEEL